MKTIIFTKDGLEKLQWVISPSPAMLLNTLLWPYSDTVASYRGHSLKKTAMAIYRVLGLMEVKLYIDCEGSFLERQKAYLAPKNDTTTASGEGCTPLSQKCPKQRGVS